MEAPELVAAGDVLLDRNKLVHEIISAAKNYLVGEEFRLNSLIDTLRGTARTRAIHQWSLADRELDPVKHRNLVLRLAQYPSTDDEVRRNLQSVISGKLSPQAALAHGWLPIALQFGANYAGISQLTGRAFKNWMKSRPEELRQAADAALKSGWFKGGRGRRHLDHIDRYVREIDKIYFSWTGQRLSTSSTVRSKKGAADLGRNVPGASLAFLMACLEPLFPGMTLAAASHHVRNARKIKD